MKWQIRKDPSDPVEIYRYEEECINDEGVAIFITPKYSDVNFPCESVRYIRADIYNDLHSQYVKLLEYLNILESQLKENLIPNLF